MNIGRNRDKLSRVQRRMALRVCSAYKTVSLEAVLVIASIPPIELQVAERKEIQEGRDRKSAREHLLQKWQERWERSNKGQWTRKLIPELEPWINRNHGELDHHLTQVLSGHGSYRNYLYGIDKTPDNECVYCGEQDSPEHTVFVCPRWGVDRERMRRSVGEEVTARNMVTLMLRAEENWRSVAEFSMNVMKRKQEDETEEYNPNP